jgi:ribonuclease HI
VGSAEARFIRTILGGRAWKRAAERSGLSEDSARVLLERLADSVADSAPGAGVSHPDLTDGPAALVISTDGASLGNPGHAGAGVVVATPDGEVIDELFEYVGEATNNVAEYEAIRIGLEAAQRLGARRITVRLDSELVTRQLTGVYKVNDKKLLNAYSEVRRLMSEFDDVKFDRIPRDENKRADRLAGMGARSGP